MNIFILYKYHFLLFHLVVKIWLVIRMDTKKKQNKSYELHPIGKVHSIEKEGKFWIEIDPKFRPGLLELDAYSHVIIIWWADQHDNENARKIMQIDEFPPFYGNNVPKMGIFATRAEYRPNPIAISATQILKIDHETGRIFISWCDAYPGTPVLDLKPYIKMSDYIEKAKYPKFLEHWPNSQEKAIEWFSKEMQNQD